MKCGVVVFPGSNGEHDVYHVLKHLFGQEVLFLWHDDDTLRDCELVVLPGGFSYGDYLRPGALAARSPIVAAVRRHAAAGGLVLGIANGFQVLLEARLLPGATRRHPDRRFTCREVAVEVERADLPFTRGYRQGQRLRLPLACGEGSYVDTPEALDALEAAGAVVLRYVEPAAGRPDPGADAVVSERGIAGICNEEGNVLGLMPHPERCAEEILDNVDGRALFTAALGLLPPAAAGEPS